MSKKNNKAEETESKVIDANFKEVDDTETNNEVPVDDNASGEQKDEASKGNKHEETKPGFLKKAWAVTKKVAPYIGGAAIGAAAMYFLGKKDGNVIVDVPFKEIPMPDVVNKAVETVTDNIPKIADSVQASAESFKLEEIPETK